MPYAITKTLVTISANSGPLIAANPYRQYLAWMNIGANPATIEPNSGPAVAGQGMVYSSGGAGAQGASEEFPNGAPSCAFQGVCAAGLSTTFVVWEGQ